MRSLRRGSLALRVFVVSVIIFALPLLIYVLVVLRQDYEGRLQDTVSHLIDMGESRASLLENANSSSVQMLGIVEAFMWAERELSDERLSGILENIVKGSDAAFAFFTREEGGEYVIVASSDSGLLDRNVSEYHFIRGTEIRGLVSFMAFGWEGFSEYFFVTKEVRNPKSGERVGILTVGTDVDAIVRDMVRREETAYPVNFALLNDIDVVVASSNEELILHRVYFSDDKKLIPQGSGEVLQFDPYESGGLAGSLDWKGSQSVAVIIPIAGTPIKLVLDASEEAVFGGQMARLIHLLIFFFLILLVGGALAWWITQRMAVPWRRLGETMVSVSHGDLTARFEEDRMGFEINSLGGIFNETIDSLCDQVALAETERVQKETLSRELDIAREIQMAILPERPPKFPGLEIAARYSAAKQVGGDFYDFYIRREGDEARDLVVTVADAAGKGISACLYSLGLRSVLRSCCASEESLPEVVRQANNIFWEDTHEAGMFVTAVMAMFDPKRRMLTYVSSGHNPGMLRRARGEVEMLRGGGLAMGVELYEEVVAHQVSLEPGDVVLFYTDGITEMRSEDRELFGEERLQSVFAGARGSADQIADGILQSVRKFQGSAPVADDLTLVVLSHL